MQKIIPHLWFDKEAKEAADFYTSIFPESRITHHSVIRDTPSGDCDILAFDLWGYSFKAISAGPIFKLNPSISFMVNFDPSRDPNARVLLDEIWSKLMDGGTALMPLDAYPFSKRYGWVQDKFGVSWQLILTNPEGEPRPSIIPSLMFTKDSFGKAEETADFYISLFDNSKRGTLARYPVGSGPEAEGKVMFSDFMLAHQWFTAMDGAGPHNFAFNEALSLVVNCENQEEIDHLWEKLSAEPASEQCGWLKDKYGVSWQIVPSAMDEMMSSGTPEQLMRVTKAFLAMKKFDIAALQQAFEGTA